MTLNVDRISCAQLNQFCLFLTRVRMVIIHLRLVQFLSPGMLIMTTLRNNGDTLHPVLMVVTPP